MVGASPGHGLDPRARVAWISTRRGSPAADSIAGNISGRYVLHDMMRSLTAPLAELSSAHAVVLEAPPIVTQRFEHDMLDLVRKATAQCPVVAIIVQPSLRRKSNKTLWVHRWNLLHDSPFKFWQTCSCKMGNAVPGCHLTCFIGTTQTVTMSPCAEVPTYSATSQSSVLSLGVTLFTLAAALLSEVGWRCDQSLSATDPRCCPSVDTLRRCAPRARADAATSVAAEAQQAPDSAHTLVAERAGAHSAHTTIAERDSALIAERAGAHSAHSTPSTEAFPTDSKEREKNRRKQQKAAGVEHVVKKRKKVMEDHHDDCGEDLSSLFDKTSSALCYPCNYDTDDALSDEDRDLCLRLQFSSRVQSFPIDVTRVAKAHPGGVDRGPDSRAALPRDSTCPACRHRRQNNDWEHTREIGQCRYPYTEPWIPECPACQDRKPQFNHNHTFEHGKCKWATASLRSGGPRTRSSSTRSNARPHEPEPKPDQDPTARMPANVEGREVGADGEEDMDEINQLLAQLDVKELEELYTELAQTE